ncbi:MAG: CotH kinase family protein [Lachnospiraceae bacterium]|nr:CotH kinase family protein [Lachnospiraceae bacterium]
MLFAVLLLAGCTGTGKGSGSGSLTKYPVKPTGAAQVTNAAKPTEAATPTAAPTPTQVPTPTAEPEPSPTPVPEVPPIALYINEVLPTNNSVSKHNGGYFDMIELYNASEETVMLSDYYLSDSKKHLTDYSLPAAELEPGGYAVFYCTGEYYKQGEYDLAFKLSYFGEKVYLSDRDGNIIDMLQYTRLPADVSYGRDGLGGYRIYTKTSLGSENSGGFGRMAELPAVDAEPGFYDGAVGVSFTTEGKIHYTLDGSTPDKYSRIWDGNPIVIDKTCALRAYAEAESCLDSFVSTYDYFIAEPEYELDVLMLSIAEGDLATMNANYRSSKKYKANISLFSKGKAEFSIDCGICVTGCTSRAYEKKSYRVKFSADYGPTKLKYRVFENLDIDEFDSLVIRSGSQDNDGPMMRDEYVSSLSVSSGYVDNVLVQAYRPVDLYINGEYRGIYYIRERIDEDMIAAHCGCEPEEVTLIEQMSEIKCGKDYKEWLDFWKYLKEHKLTDDAVYEYAESMVDLNSVADYFIIQLWCGNVDPDNVRVARAGDGKWFYVLYDLDLCLCREVKGTTDRYMGKFNSGLYTFNALVYRLLETEKFREIFCERFAVLAKTVFSDETALAYIDDLAGRLDHDMVYNCDKWHGFDDPSHDIKYRSYKSWTEAVESLRKAVKGRAKLIVEDFCEEKKISEELRNKYFSDILGKN